MASALDEDQVVQVQALAGAIVMCSWARHSTLTVTLFTQMYKMMDTGKFKAGGKPCDGLASHLGERGGRNTPSDL